MLKGSAFKETNIEYVKAQALWCINYRIDESKRDDICKSLFEMYRDKAFDAVHFSKLIGLITEDEASEFLHRIKSNWEA